MLDRIEERPRPLFNAFAEKSNRPRNPFTRASWARAKNAAAKDARTTEKADRAAEVQTGNVG